MSTTFATVVIEQVTCGKCGIVFGLNADFIVARRRDHETFYCPNGHGRCYPGKSDIEKERDRANQLSDELARANTRALHARQDAEHEKRKAAAAKGQMTKLRKRIAKGICPCCNRYFRALHDHVAKQHPDYVLPEGVSLDG